MKQWVKYTFLNSIIHDMHDRRYIPIKYETFEPLVNKIMSLLNK